jgi:hypothetical protein
MSNFKAVHDELKRNYMTIGYLPLLLMGEERDWDAASALASIAVLAWSSQLLSQQVLVLESMRR